MENAERVGLGGAKALRELKTPTATDCGCLSIFLCFLEFALFKELTGYLFIQHIQK